MHHSICLYLHLEWRGLRRECNGWNQHFVDANLVQHLSLRRKFSPFNHSTISLPSKRPMAFICFTFLGMNLMFTYGYSHACMCILIRHVKWVPRVAKGDAGVTEGGGVQSQYDGGAQQDAQGNEGMPRICSLRYPIAIVNSSWNTCLLSFAFPKGSLQSKSPSFISDPTSMASKVRNKIQRSKEL